MCAHVCVCGVCVFGLQHIDIPQSSSLASRTSGNTSSSLSVYLPSCTRLVGHIGSFGFFEPSFTPPTPLSSPHPTLLPPSLTRVYGTSSQHIPLSSMSFLMMAFLPSPVKYRKFHDTLSHSLPFTSSLPSPLSHHVVESAEKLFNLCDEYADSQKKKSLVWPLQNTLLIISPVC